MVIDRLTKLLLAALAVAALAIGGVSMYLAFAPSPATAGSDDVEMASACNAYIEGERPWCAQVFKIDGGKAFALGVDLVD